MQTLLNRLRLLLVPVIAAAVLAGCAAGRGGKLPYDNKNFVAPDPVAPAVLDPDYRIAPLDKLSVRVFRFDDLSGDYSVDLRGNISMPLIGTVPAFNQTPEELQRQLAQKLGAKYIQNPDVTVGIKESVGSAITVQGSVKQPGVYPYLGQLTLLQAVASARGYDDNANPRRVAIFRTIDGKRMGAAFDLLAIQRGEAEDPRVYRGDIIVVDGSATKSTFRTILQSIPLLAVFGGI